jgi:transposase
MINAWHRSNETSKRLDAIPGVGPALATALVASITVAAIALASQLPIPC